MVLPYLLSSLFFELAPRLYFLGVLSRVALVLQSLVFSSCLFLPLRLLLFCYQGSAGVRPHVKYIIIIIITRLLLESSL